MRHICTIFLALCVFYFSSCSSNSSTTTVTTVDSVSKGGAFQIWIPTQSGTVDYFNVNDYTLNGVAAITLYANIMYASSDSLWHLNLQLIDYKLKNAGVIFSGTSTTATGNYTNTGSGNTVIDYTNNVNLTYQILSGSTVSITQSTYPIQGSFSFNLNHNYFNSVATGNFIIYK